MTKIQGQRKSTKFSDMAMLCVRYAREVLDIRVTKDEVWNQSKTGELYPFFFMYANVREYYAPSRGKFLIDDFYEGSTIICFDEKWELIGYGTVIEIDRERPIDDVATTAIVKLERSGKTIEQDLHFAEAEYSLFWIIKNIPDGPYILQENMNKKGSGYLEPLFVVESATTLSKKSPEDEFTIVSWSSLDDSVAAWNLEGYRGQVFKNGIVIREKSGHWKNKK